jgi:chromosome segregation ATPase
LELQVKDATSLQKDFDLKKEELEMESKATVDKICVLRDIIGELENQLEAKSQHEATLLQQLRDLQVILEQQSKTQQELTEELDSLRLDSGKSQLTERIIYLEEQLRKHRLYIEQFQSNSTAVRQMKAQLRDLQATVDKKTKDLELFHTTISSASCSSPSEDVSIREHLDASRCDTPEERRNTLSPVCLPLDELHRLQDKLQHHSRAEEVALKRVRDLEMQLKRVKKNEEEVAAERDVLQERVEQLLLRISALQSRVDEQRHKDDRQLKEVTLELQTKICDQDQEITILREKLEIKEKEVKELKTTLQETRRIMEAHEKEWHTRMNEELETIKDLRETCKRLKAENSVLESNSKVTTSDLREEMRHHTADTSDGMLSLGKEDMLFTSRHDIVSSGSEKDFEDKNIETMLIKKDKEILSLRNQLAASLVQRDELQRCKLTNIELTNETVDLHKEIETLKEKVSELVAENHILKGDLNRLPGTPDELAGQVQKELDILNQMDTSIMEQLSTNEAEMSEDVAFACVLPSPVLSQILNKALRDGISALQMSEFSQVHQEICRAAYARTMQDSATQMESDTLAPSTASDNQQLMATRIAALENEIVCRQQESLKRIVDLEENVHQEKKRAREVQESLNQEQKLRAELENHVKLQSQSLADLEKQRHTLQWRCSFLEDQIGQFLVELDKERARTNELQVDLQRGKSTVKDLQGMLENERQRARDAKLKDAALIEELRINLDRVLNNETRQQFKVEQVKQTQESLHWKGAPQKVCACTQTMCFSSETSSFYKDKLKLEKERSAKLDLELQREKQRGKELETAVEKEKQLGQQKLEIETEIVHELKRELLIVEGQRDSLTSQLIHLRKQLNLSRVETDALERRVRVLRNSEAQRQRSRVLEQEELDINRRELQKAQSLQFDQEQKIIDLEQEVSRLKQELLERKAQMVATGHDQDTAKLRQRVEKLKQDLQDSRLREQQLSRKMSSSTGVPSPVLGKIKNVNVMLEQHVTENAEVALTLSRLTEERQQLQLQVRELEEQLKIAAKSQAADHTGSVHVEFAAERALWAQEKAALKLALAQAESDAVHASRVGDDTDTSDRIKQLSWKYLRSESYCKALVWQKRYLLLVLGGYQEAEAITVSRLAQLSGVQEAMLCRQQPVPRKKARTRFKTAAIVIIALSRMHFLVRRWQHRRHTGSSPVLTRGLSESTLSSFHGPRRRGSSTSVNSLKIPRAPAQGHGLLSPPSRDQPLMQRSTESIPVSLLRPSHVAEFVDRFDELQRRLGLSLPTSPP